MQPKYTLVKQKTGEAAKQEESKTHNEAKNPNRVILESAKPKEYTKLNEIKFENVKLTTYKRNNYNVKEKFVNINDLKKYYETTE